MSEICTNMIRGTQSFVFENSNLSNLFLEFYYFLLQIFSCIFLNAKVLKGPLLY